MAFALTDLTNSYELSSEGTLSIGGDVVSTYFGIREIGTAVFGANNRRYITLNGKPYFINGSRVSLFIWPFSSC